MNRRVAIALLAATPILASLSAACSGADGELESSGSTSEAAKKVGSEGPGDDDSTTVVIPHRDAGVRDTAPPPCEEPSGAPTWLESCKTNRYFVHRIGVALEIAQLPSTTLQTRALFTLPQLALSYPCDDLSSVQGGPVTWHGAPLFPGTASQICSYTWVGTGVQDWATLAAIAVTHTGAQGMIITEIYADVTPAPTCGSNGVVCGTPRAAIPCFLTDSDTCPIHSGIAICPACGTTLSNGTMIAVLPSDTSKWSVTPVGATSPIYFSAPAGAQTFIMTPPAGTTFGAPGSVVQFDGVD